VPRRMRTTFYSGVRLLGREAPRTNLPASSGASSARFAPARSADQSRSSHQSFQYRGFARRLQEWSEPPAHRRWRSSFRIANAGRSRPASADFHDAESASCRVRRSSSVRSSPSVVSDQVNTVLSGRLLNQAANAAVKATGTMVYRRLVPRLGHAPSDRRNRPPTVSSDLEDA
jgi:hypothetical protein